MINNELSLYHWMNKPKNYVVEKNRLIIETEPETDLWQRTFYGTQKVNAPAFMREIEGDFTFLVKTEFEESSFLYDQCGLLMFVDDENWIKVSVEFCNEQVSWLGSVVTNLGYSDWAATNIPSVVSEMYYRFSKRDQDFFIENSFDGVNYMQMRMLHMHKIPEKVNIGVYACSPLQNSFNAVFSVFGPGPCQWEEYKK